MEVGVIDGRVVGVEGTTQHKGQDMSKERLAQLSEDLYNHVFQMLDAEQDIDSMDAGGIATAVQETFERRTRQAMGELVIVWEE